MNSQTESTGRTIGNSSNNNGPVGLNSGTQGQHGTASSNVSEASNDAPKKEGLMAKIKNMI